MKKLLNIAVLAPYRVYPPVSGGQRCAALLYKYVSAEVPVTVLSVNTNGTPEGDVKLEKISGDSKLRYINPFLFFRIRRYIRQNKITHFIMEHPYFGWMGPLIRSSCNTPFIIRSHNIEGQRFRSMGKPWWRLLAAYEKRVHRKADLSLFITEEDLNYAVQHFGLKKERCVLITYGTEIRNEPSAEEHKTAREKISAAHRIAPDEKILLFNGILDYQPNIDAVKMITEKINPVLLQTPGFRYRIIICGKNLPPEFNDLKEYAGKNITYAGFVEDINAYFTGANIFINPVTDGGGIKTKLVEALGMGLSAVSTASGAAGIPLSITNEKLKIVNDNDTAAFCNAIISAFPDNKIPPAFYAHFYWGNVAAVLQQSLLS